MPRKILHIDDNEDDLELIKWNIQHKEPDLEIDFAFSADQARKMLAESNYDCLLSDYNMPSCNGLQFLEELRSNGIMIPFIFLTGQGNEAVAVDALRKGASDYFAKAPGMAFYERLLNNIHNYIEAYQSHLASLHYKEALEKSENKFRILFNSISDAVFVHPFYIEGFANFSEVNNAACERYGYSRQELLELKAPDITDSSFAILHAKPEHREELLRSGTMVFGAVHKTKSGTTFPVEISSNIVTIEEKDYILAVARDISDRNYENN